MPTSTVSKAVKRLRKWNPLKVFRNKAIPKDSYLEGPAFAKYRREMAADPETVLKTKSFSNWQKSRKKTARPN